MGAEEQDASRTSAESTLPEPEGSAAPNLPPQEVGPTGPQFENETAQPEEPPRNVFEERLPCLEEVTGEGGAGSGEAEFRLVCEGSEAAACMDESAVLVSTGREGETAACVGGGGDEVVVDERRSVVAAAPTTSPQVQSPVRVAQIDGEESAACAGGGGDDVVVDERGPVVAAVSASSLQLRSLAPVAQIDGDESAGCARGEGDDGVVDERRSVVERASAQIDGGSVVGGEESKTAADVTVSESAGDGPEEMEVSGVEEADKKRMEEKGITPINVAVEESQVVVEETGKKTGDVADKVVEDDIGVDRLEEVERQSEATAKADEEDMEEVAITSTADAVEDSKVVVEETGKETRGVADKLVEEDIRMSHMEEVKSQSEAVAEETELEGTQQIEEEAGKMEIVHGKADGDGTEAVDDVSLAAVDDELDQRVEAAREINAVQLEADDELDQRVEAAREINAVQLEAEEDRALAVKEAAGVVDESTDAAGAVEDSTAIDMAGVEMKKAEDDKVAEAKEAAWDNRNVDDDMLEVEMKKTDDNMVVGDDEAQEDDEVEEADMDNKEVDEDMLEEAEAEAAEDMEVLHEDTYATEETDATEEAEKDEEVSRSGAGTKRKRGRAAKASTPRISSRKKMEEDVCFVCFDGGDLVLCDRRGCPKAYHPSCVNRDEAFFRTKGQWNCGWHLCSNCGKNASYMCYTCTYSLCKTCIRDGSIACIRKNKGFCRTCMKTITMIEDDLKGDDDMGQVDFDDKSSWEYLFKDYYMNLKASLSLTKEEITMASNLLKGSEGLVGKQESLEVYGDSENSGRDTGVTVPKRRQSKRRAKSHTIGSDSPVRSDLVGSGKASFDDNLDWASKELVEFVMHMRNGDRSILSQYDVQALLLEYIKRNKLRDPKRKSQIICDQRLQNLFGKPRVGHFEMLKLLESHYFMKDDTDGLQGTDVDADVNQSEVDVNFDVSQKAGRDKKRKARKKGDHRGPQSNQDDYAAIDTHNINLMYLRRNLLEDLIEDAETFHDKVVGSFVRIRISGSNQKQDLYRLVPVVGTSKATEQYKVGKRMTGFLLEILNLNKTEIISIDIISNQEFTEDECKRLRQSIKCGLINRLTVGNILEKAMALQAVRVKDWLEAETVRLSHLRDRASDMGRRKELRECVEKLQLLKTPEERQRRLEEFPEIHVDPKMDPSYESEEDEVEADDKRQENYMRGARGTSSYRGREPISPQKGGPTSYDSWSSGTRNTPMTPSRELSRNLSGKGLVSARDDYGAEIVSESSSWSRAKERETPYQLSSRDNMSMHISSATSEAGANRITSNAAVPETRPTVAPQSAPKVNESEKMWHYQDPAGKIQGPFSMVQLRKWNNTGYFPVDLRIWKTTEGQEDSILLADALNGKFQRDPPSHSNLEHNRGALMGKPALSSVEVPKYSGSGQGSSGSGTNLPSPTPGQAMTPIPMPGQTMASQTRSTSVFSAGSVGGQAPMLASNASHSLSQGAQRPDSSISAPTQLHSQTTVPGDVYPNQAVSLHNLVQAVVRNQNQSNPVQAEAVAQSSAHKPEVETMKVPALAQVQGQWAATGGGAMPSSAQSFATYGSSGSANAWQASGSNNQPNAQSPALPNMNWPFGNSNNNSNNAGNNYGTPTTQNTGWTQMQGSAAWTAPPAPIPGNGSMNWVGQAQGAPAGNPAWQAQRQVQPPVNPTHMGWAPSGNPNAGFIAQGQAPAPTGSNPSTWAPPGNQNGDGSQRNAQWNRQYSFGSSGGGGGGGGPSRMAGWCRFFRENGHCKKGASCNYRHT